MRRLPIIGAMLLLISCSNDQLPCNSDRGMSSPQSTCKETVAEVVDMTPTILDLLSVPIDTAWGLDGRTLILS